MTDPKHNPGADATGSLVHSDDRLLGECHSQNIPEPLRPAVLQKLIMIPIYGRLLRLNLGHSHYDSLTSLRTSQTLYSLLHLMPQTLQMSCFLHNLIFDYSKRKHTLS